MNEPEVSWKALESGAKVLSRDGEEVGTVHRVVGDADADIFTGLAVKLSLLGSERFLAAERVTGIWPDRVEVDLTADQARNLPEHEDAPTVRVRPGRPGFFARLFGRS